MDTQGRPHRRAYLSRNGYARFALKKFGMADIGRATDHPARKMSAPRRGVDPCEVGVNGQFDPFVHLTYINRCLTPCASLHVSACLPLYLPRCVFINLADISNHFERRILRHSLYFHSISQLVSLIVFPQHQPTGVSHCVSTASANWCLSLCFHSIDQLLHRGQRAKEWTLKQLLDWIAAQARYSKEASEEFWRAIQQLAFSTISCLPDPTPTVALPPCFPSPNSNSSTHASPSPNGTSCHQAVSLAINACYPALFCLQHSSRACIYPHLPNCFPHSNASRPN